MNRDAFKPFADSLSARACHLLIDFPGFGASPLPPLDWGTAEYADALADFIEPYRDHKKVIWAGHSFGCRVGIQLAARHQNLIDGLFLLSAAGLPRRRNIFQKLQMRQRIYTFKILKILAPLFNLDLEMLKTKVGSADYRKAGAMRSIFVRTVRENLSLQAQKIKCPTQLVYGEEDKETPPEIGERLQKLIPHADLAILPGQDHYSVLGAGRHIVIKRFADFMETI
jgi:pimeloyl-ACP methyl ester carboxylesterase